MGQLCVLLDAAPAVRDLELLSEAADRLPELRKRLLGLGHFGFELSRVERDGPPAVPAGDVLVRLELGDALRELARAVRAGEFDAL